MIRNRSKVTHLVVINVSLLIITFVTLPAAVATSIPLSFDPPNQITLDMYALDQFGAIIQADTPCQSDDVRYGCTYFDGGIIGKSPAKPYPFQDDTIEIGIEGDTAASSDSSQQGYLHNVISQEMTEGSRLASYTAQAIAARTYAYHQTKPDNPGDPNKTIDNSAAMQVYLPYRYDGLGEGLGAAVKLERQTTVSQAITLPGALYMTHGDFSTDPIVAYFGADNCTWTESGPNDEDYLQAVYDPISTKPDPCDNQLPSPHLGTPNGGLGTAGASRWGYGSTSEYGTSGNPWSVRWESGLQILTHYYTDIDIRDSSGNIVTPQYRWNPLDVDWNIPGVITAPVLYPGQTYNLTVLGQNTGAREWFEEVPFVELAYFWETQSSLITGTNAITIQNGLQPGQVNYSSLDIEVPANFTTGQVVTLTLDMRSQWADPDQYFHNGGLPWYPLAYVCVIGSHCYWPADYSGQPGDGDGDIYLPIIMKNAS